MASTTTTTQNTLVGTWNLKDTNLKPAQESLLIGAVADAGVKESALADDARKLVPPQERRPGGLYYSVVKLQIRYEKQPPGDNRWAQGTGWLIEHDILVTAGHCVYDHTYEFGRASEIKAYVGYNGRASFQPKDPKFGDVQFRRGIKVATTDGWLQSDVNRANDVGFVQLESAFHNVEPIKFHPTPTKGTEILGVVGYPADRTFNDEPAAQMYYMFAKTAFDLDKSSLNMLEYTISSYAGQSGSPVFVKDTNSALGAHVYGLGNKNSASVIKGKYGNYYKSCIQTFKEKLPTVKNIAGITYVTVPTIGAETGMSGDPNAPVNDAEGFWDALKSVVHVGAPIAANILQMGSPFLGPVGGVAAGLAGTLLGVAGKMTESTMGTESSLDTSCEWKQPCSRAVLAEAALQTVLKMDSNKAKKLQILNNMQNHYTRNKEHVRPIAKVLGPALLGPVLRVSQMNQDPEVTSRSESSFPAMPSPAEGESSLGSDEAAFVRGMQEAAAAAHSGTQEFSFGGFFNGLLKVGTKVAPVALDVLGKVLGGSKGAESSLVKADDDMQPHLESLCHRAVLAEAALQSLMAIPPHEMRAEGFFDSMLKTVKKIGGTVVKVAPHLVRAITPILSAVVKGDAPSGGMVPAPGTETGLDQPPADGRSKPGGMTVEDVLLSNMSGAFPSSLSANQGSVTNSTGGIPHGEAVA